MASLNKEQSGSWRIQWTDDEGRRTVRLGKIPKKTAEHIRVKVESLISAKASTLPLDQETSKWLAEVDAKLEDRLFRVGLIASKRASIKAEGLKAFLRSYLDGRKDITKSTRVVRGLVIGDLTTFFGEDRDLRSIHSGDADNFKQWLIGRGLAPTTIHKRLQNARSFFLAAKRRKLIDENPFDGVHMPASGIRDRQRFISREHVSRVLDACPDHHWRTIVALSRYGGLRCPSEVLTLKWENINWETSRMLVESPKMERYTDKAIREVPIFPELKPFLEEAWGLAPEGAVDVVDARFRNACQGGNGWKNTNLRTTFHKIIKRAGLVPWPRPFHNLRASRETELVENFPIQVVTDWLGNSPKIAIKHYLQTTEEHFQKATQNPTYSGAARVREDSQAPIVQQGENQSPQWVASLRKLLQDKKIAVEGFEPPTRGL